MYPDHRFTLLFLLNYYYRRMHLITMTNMYMNDQQGNREWIIQIHVHRQHNVQEILFVCLILYYLSFHWELLTTPLVPFTGYSTAFMQFKEIINIIFAYVFQGIVDIYLQMLNNKNVSRYSSPLPTYFVQNYIFRFNLVCQLTV